MCNTGKLKRAAFAYVCWICLLVQSRGVDQYLAISSSQKGAGEIVLNGFPVLEFSPRGVTKNAVWNPYLRQGRNELMLVVSNFTAAGFTLAGEVKIRDQGGAETSFLSYGAELKSAAFGLLWTDAVKGITNATSVAVRSLTNGFSLQGGAWNSFRVMNDNLMAVASFSVDAFPVVKLPWEESPGLQSSQDIQELKSTALGAIDSFASTNIERCLGLFAIRNAHFAESFGVPVRQIEEEQRKTFTALFSDSSHKLSFSKADEIIPLSGFGWKVVRFKLQPLLRLQGNGSGYIMLPFYAKINGKWICVD